MIYFSEIRYKKVVTDDGIEVGKIEDFIFLISENPIVTKIVVRSLTKEKLIISVDYVKKINHVFVIEKHFLTSYLEENELHLVKNLLDKQIIDIKGNKVVRVNDVAMQQGDHLYIAGVDIGLYGLFRRLRILSPGLYRLVKLLKLKSTSDFLSWADIQPLELMRGKVKLRIKEEKLSRIRPEDLADYLEQTNVINARKFLKILDLEKAAEVISNLNINYQTSLFKNFKPEEAAKLLSYIDPDEAVDVLMTLSKTRRAEILSYTDSKLTSIIFHLLSLSHNSIGRLATSEFMTCQPDQTVTEVINSVKKNTTHFSSLDYIYVTNKKEELVGVFSIHELLLNNSDEPIYKIMTQNVVVIHLTTPEEIALKKMIKYKLYALPIIDDNKKILGLVTLDDLNEFLKKKI